ncbi:MAG TPA: succinylglutamate desuccinylase/aspartoacylase family protein [Candidatus Saccharimonadales bacterium]|nr:succinylglutamate desuccinylase/aspartoacylase family protein [Candidatus Saccharimonadales bacterium]
MSAVMENRALDVDRPAVGRHSVARLLEPLHALAESSQHIISKSFGFFESHGREYSLPRYVFLGPKGGGDTIRIGIFATIHGDEPEGTLGLTRFVQELVKNPDLAQGYALFIYPICNPTGFEDGTRRSRSGKDLNREFWKDSPEPEVRFLETEIWSHAFHGLINLHCDDTSSGLYGFVNGEVLSENLLEPALRAAETFLPRNRKRKIDGFKANKGIVYDCYRGILTSVPGLNPPPFEITLETPHKSPRHLQVEAFSSALQTILLEYRYMMAVAANI